MFEEFRNKRVLITGATGLIGQAIVKSLLEIGAIVIAVVRNVDKAYRIFGEDAPIVYIQSDITKLEIVKMDINYIIHAASNTSSKAFVQDPVGIICTSFEGTHRTLEIGRLSNIEGYIYLSSMEVYGTPTTDERINELHSTNLNTMMARSAYPESKRMCESLCTAYYSQYGIPVKIIRLTQTFGPGVLYDDGRVFAEFARCVIENKDIILHTKGETKRSYLYTQDAVTAILTVLLRGKIGEAYNAANEDTYCTIHEMAQLVAEDIAMNRIKVRIEEKDINEYGYASTLHMNLDTTKINELGWKAEHGLKEMFKELCVSMRNSYISKQN